MVRIELSEADVATLKDVLDSYLSDLRMEIADTDRMDFREGLKDRKKVLESLLDRIGAAGSA
jgi:predicted metal-dependent HD superfamily phosphohydrolase